MGQQTAKIGPEMAGNGPRRVNMGQNTAHEYHQPCALKFRKKNQMPVSRKILTCENFTETYHVSH